MSIRSGGQIQQGNAADLASSEKLDVEKASAAVKAVRSKSRDEQVVAVLTSQAVTLQRAFVLGCHDLPASQHGAWEGRAAAGAAASLTMTAEQLLKQALGEPSASADSPPAALAASPVVVHLPTPCTLHVGGLQQCTWLDSSRPAPRHLLICDVPRQQLVAAIDAVAPDRQLSFEQYQRFVAIAAFLKYPRDDVFEPTRKVEAAIANLIGWCNEEQAVAACRAGTPLLPPPPDAAAATAIQARVRANLGRRLHLLRLWAATTLQLGARRRLARVVVAAMAQRRRLEALAQEDAAAAAQAAAQAQAQAQAQAANPRALRRLSKAQRQILLHTQQAPDDATTGKLDEAGLAALRAARRHSASSLARSRVSASSVRTAKTKVSTGSKPSEGSGSSAGCRSRPRRRARRGSAAAQTKGVDLNTLLAYAAELLPAEGEDDAPPHEAALSPTKETQEWRPECEASWAQPEPVGPRQPEPRPGSPVKTVNLAAIQLRGRGKGTVALSIKAGAGGDASNSGGSSENAEEQHPPPRQPPPPPPLRTAPTAMPSPAQAEGRRQTAPRATRSSAPSPLVRPSPRASPLARGSSSAPPTAMLGLSREPRVRAGPRASPLMAGMSPAQALPAAATTSTSTAAAAAAESSFQRRAGKRFTGVPHTLAGPAPAQLGPLFNKVR